MIARIPEDFTDPDGEPLACAMFVLCRNDATLLIPHPVLDFVPACERCAVKLGYDISGDLPLAEIEFS